MDKIKTLKSGNFTSIDNTIARDKRVSLRARGMLLTIMSLPDDWKFTVNGLVSILKESRGIVYKVIDELIELGYCTRKKRAKVGGQFRGSVYTFYDNPSTASSIPNPVERTVIKQTKENKAVSTPQHPQSYIQVGDTYVGQSDDFFANLEEIGPNENPQPQFLIDISPEDEEKGPPIPDSVFHHMFRICYGASTVDEQKFLDSKMRGRVASVLGKLRDADADWNQMIIFENWWKNSWMSGQRNGSYTPPRPEQVMEYWLTATSGKKHVPTTVSGTDPSPSLDEIKNVMQWRPPNE